MRWTRRMSVASSIATSSRRTSCSAQATTRTSRTSASPSARPPTGRPRPSGGWAGTPGYVAPEQIRGDHVDLRADVYALGCVLVHAVTGAPPYVRDGDNATLRAHLNAPLPLDRVPPQLADVVGRALAKDPRARYGSAGELGRAALVAVGAAPRPARGGVRLVAVSPEVVHVPAHEGDTHPSPPSRIGTRSERWRAVGVAVTMLALAALAFAGIARVGEPVRAGTALATAPALTAAPPVRVGARPDAIAMAGGRVWVLSSALGEIHVLDAVTGKPRGRVDLGASAPGAAIAAGFGALWAVKASTRSLIRLGVGTHRHVDTAITLDVTGSPDRIAIGDDAVWVAARARGGGAESIVAVDPESLAQRRVAVPGRHAAHRRGARWPLGDHRWSGHRDADRPGPPCRADVRHGRRARRDRRRRAVRVGDERFDGRPDQPGQRAAQAGPDRGPGEPDRRRRRLGVGPRPWRPPAHPHRSGNAARAWHDRDRRRRRCARAERRPRAVASALGSHSAQRIVARR